MGLFFTKNLPNVRLGIWEITESTEVLYRQARLTPFEQDFYKQLKSPLRQKHWLSYRLILPHFMEKEAVSGIAYDEFGKPYLENGAGQISVAHSGKYATLIISKTKRVGIDIEAIQPKIVKLTHKFLTKEEMEYKFTSRAIESLCVIWCAKEALYKLQGGRGLVFSEHIHINNFTFTGNGHLTGYVIREHKRSQYHLFYESLDEYILVYTIE
jgi:4'-phosphopantetheinyl transferase